MHTRALVATALIAFAASLAGAGPISPFDPETGYRIARYRAPTGASVPGGVRIDSYALDQLFAEDGAVLIDVMPAEGAGPDPVSGRWRLSKQRHHIPGSHWLPDVGYGRLNPRMARYFEHNLARLSGANNARALIFYCQADCWMSWNAVKRAAELGYSRLYWYAEGTDGWRELDRPLVPADPVPVIGP